MVYQDNLIECRVCDNCFFYEGELDPTDPLEWGIIEGTQEDICPDCVEEGEGQCN